VPRRKFNSRKGSKVAFLEGIKPKGEKGLIFPLKNLKRKEPTAIGEEVLGKGKGLFDLNTRQGASRELRQGGEGKEKRGVVLRIERGRSNLNLTEFYEIQGKKLTGWNGNGDRKKKLSPKTGAIFLVYKGTAGRMKKRESRFMPRGPRAEASKKGKTGITGKAASGEIKRSLFRTQ